MEDDLTSCPSVTTSTRQFLILKLVVNTHTVSKAVACLQNCFDVSQYHLSVSHWNISHSCVWIILKSKEHDKQCLITSCCFLFLTKIFLLFLLKNWCPQWRGRPYNIEKYFYTIFPCLFRTTDVRKNAEDL